MKIQNSIRMQAVVIGFAGVLFLASSLTAQEITNTEWPDAPGATTTVQASAAPGSSRFSMASGGNLGHGLLARFLHADCIVQAGSSAARQP
jgi:hypothetical protein